MKRDYPISVALASYNGEKFIKEQLESILMQLSDIDEIIISDDGSTDSTRQIIADLNDARITLVDGPHKGVKQNFANAISKCKGAYIFLCDQDDLWEQDKVEKVLTAFSENCCSCVIHDATVFNSDTGETILDSFFAFRNSRKGIVKNIWKNSYIGCCMAFSSKMTGHILPIPEDIEMHDQWIGLLCEKYGNSVFLKDKLIRYRRHDATVTKLSHNPVSRMIRNRIAIIRRIISR